MELDELKSIWNKNQDFKLKGPDELASMLRADSRSLVENLKKSVWFELLITVVASIALLIYAFTLPDGSLKWTAVSIVILFAAYLFYYVKKLALLMKFNSDENLKDSLQKLVESLNSYLRFYKLSYTILYPVYFGLGVLFGGIESGSERFLQLVVQPRSIIILVVTGLIFFFLCTRFANWYLKKLYGKHLTKLETVLNELNSFGE